MENLTNSNETAYRFRREIRFSNFAISSILAVFSLYVLVALVYNQICLEEPRNKNFFRLTLGRKYSLLSKYTCIAITIVSLIRQLGSIGGFLVANNVIFSNESIHQSNVLEIYCDVLPPIGNFVLTAGSGLVYLFLWFRQRVFYVQSSLLVINSKCLRVFSTAIIILWIMFWVSLSLVYFIRVSYRYDKTGVCQYVLDTGRDWTYGEIIVVWCVASLLMQLCLLGLFIYPMLKRDLWIKTQNGEENVRNKILMRRVKKALMLSSVCLGTDILSGVILAILHKEGSNGPIFPFNLNLFINHSATIACFDNWKQMLWPWNVKRYAKNSSSESQAQHTTDFGADTSIVEPRTFLY